MQNSEKEIAKDGAGVSPAGSFAIEKDTPEQRWPAASASSGLSRSPRQNSFRKILLNNIAKAYKGRTLWLDLVKKYELGEKDYVILMPSASRDYNYYGLLYFNQFMEQARAQRGIILTFDERVIKTAALFSANIAHIVEFSREQAELLMKFYCLYMFTDKLVIISLEEPEGRNDLRVIDRKGRSGRQGMTLEEAMAIGVYGLKKFVPANAPVYDGSDVDIRSFLGNEVTRHAM